MADLFSPDEIEKTRQLLLLFETNQLLELSVSDADGFAVDIVAGSFVAPPVIAPAIAAPTQQHEAPASHAPKQSVAAKSKLNSLNSPMVGIFYAASAPGDPPFVNVGDLVSVGQTIGLIEAMKVFSEIPAESSGRIVEIVAETGALVQQSEPLFRIDPT